MVSPPLSVKLMVMVTVVVEVMVMMMMHYGRNTKATNTPLENTTSDVSQHDVIGLAQYIAMKRSPPRIGKTDTDEPKCSRRATTTNESFTRKDEEAKEITKNDAHNPRQGSAAACHKTSLRRTGTRNLLERHEGKVVRSPGQSTPLYPEAVSSEETDR